MLFAPLVEAGLVELKHVELRAEEFAERGARAAAGLPGGWIADFPDPDNFLYFLLNSKAQTVYPLGYRNAELDKLMSEARVTIDPERRKQLYRRAEKLPTRTAPSSRSSTTACTRRRAAGTQGCACTRRRRRCASRTCGWTLRWRPEQSGLACAESACRRLRPPQAWSQAERAHAPSERPHGRPLLRPHLPRGAPPWAPTGSSLQAAPSPCSVAEPGGLGRAHTVRGAGAAALPLPGAHRASGGAGGDVPGRPSPGCLRSSGSRPRRRWTHCCSPRRSGRGPASCGSTGAGAAHRAEMLQRAPWSRLWRPACRWRDGGGGHADWREEQRYAGPRRGWGSAPGWGSGWGMGGGLGGMFAGSLLSSLVSTAIGSVVAHQFLDGFDAHEGAAGAPSRADEPRAGVGLGRGDAGTTRGWFDDWRWNFGRGATTSEPVPRGPSLGRAATIDLVRAHQLGLVRGRGRVSPPRAAHG